MLIDSTLPVCPAPTLMIADDHAAIQMVLSQIATRNLTDWNVCTVSCADGLLDSLIKPHPPGLLVLDLNMPGDLKSLALVRAVRRLTPEVPVIVYSADDSPCLVAALLDAGVRGYVSKAAPLAVIEQAIVKVLAGDEFVAPGIDIDVGRKHPWHQLTGAERGVLVHLAKGRTMQDIVNATGRSYSTISAQKYKALRKLDLSSDAQISPYFIEHGLRYALHMDVEEAA